MENISEVLLFLKVVIITTFNQLIWLLGLIFVFGIVLYALARFTRVTFIKTVGLKADIIFTGWIGVPVHELGHAIFCLLFGHKIVSIQLYRPNSKDGTLGYVNHTYNSKSTYQKIGNFFIGIGPILIGSLALYAALYYLVPNHNAIYGSIKANGVTLVKGVQGEFGAALIAIWESSKAILRQLFVVSNFTNYKFWIFLYISLSIASHMQLSPPDIKGASGGLATIVIFFLLMNLIVLGLEVTGVSIHFGSFWKYVKLENYSFTINRWLGMLGALLAFASIISVFNFLVTYLVLSVYNIIRGRGLINPVS